MAQTGSKSLFPILLVNFIGSLGYSIVLPFLIILVIKFGGNEIVYGILGATYSFFQLIGAPVLGRWSDRLGRKRVLLLSQAGTFAAWILFLVALLLPNESITEINSDYFGILILTLPLIFLFMARALDGITGGNVSVANAYLADISTDENRKSNFGRMAASANLGFIIGPIFAGVLGSTILGELLPVLIAMGISLVALFVISLMMKETKQCKIESNLERDQINSVLGQEHKECYSLEGKKESLGSIWKLPHIPFMLIIYFLVFLAFNFFYVAFPVHAIQALEWTLLELGVFFSFVGLVMVVVQGPLLSRISTRFSASRLSVLGSLSLGISFFFFTSGSDLWIYLGVVLFSFGNGIMWPSFLSILSTLGDKSTQGAIQGFASSTGSLASIIGLLVGGAVYSGLGALTFVLPGAIILIIFLLTFRLGKIESANQ